MLADIYIYDEKNKTMEEISIQLNEEIREKVLSEKYHLIGHSLGNIIIRFGFHKNYPPGLGRIVSR